MDKVEDRRAKTVKIRDMSAWARFFIRSSIAQIFVVLSYVATIISVNNMDNDQQVGASLAFGVYFMLIFLAASLLALICFIGITTYILMGKPQSNKEVILLMLSWIIALVLMCYVGFMFSQS